MKGTEFTIKQKIIAVLFPALLIVFNLFLFGPFTIYSGNFGEFAISLASILKSFLVPSLVMVVIMTAIGFFLPKKLHGYYVSLLLVSGVLLWLQGNIFTWNYGVLGNKDIDWTKDTWRGWVDGTTWAVLFLSGLMFSKHVNKIATSASVALVSLQAALLLFNSFKQPEIWKNEIKYSPPAEELFQFSSKQNVIHIVLDELQSDVFQKIIREDSAHYYNALEGFTFFKENVGSAPSTILGVPSFLGGQTYQNNIPIEDFIDSTYKGNTIPNVLYDHGFEVDLAASQDWYGRGKHTNWYNIPVPYGVAKDDYEDINYALMMNFVEFRYSPHFLKKIVLEKQFNSPLFNQNATEPYEALRHFSHESFLQDMINNISVTREKPVYKLIHLTTTHWPTVVNENCEYAGQILPFTWENIQIQAKCSFDHFMEFLDKLKATGVYDSALIIINADHGYYKVFGSVNQVNMENVEKNLEKDFLSKEDFAEKICASAPLLAIKPPHRKGPMQTSDALTSLTDLPATVSSLLRMNEVFDGKSVFEIAPDEARERKFYYYYELNRAGEPFFDRIDEYLVRGKSRSATSWQFVSKHLPPGASYVTQKLVFGTNESIRFLRTGWSYREVAPDNDSPTVMWAVGNSASIFLTLPKSQTYLSANVRSPFFDEPQSIKVKVDGKEAGSWVSGNTAQWEHHSVFIDADANRPDVSIVEFVFSVYHKPDQQEMRRLAALFESITLSDKEIKDSVSTLQRAPAPPPSYS